MSLVVDRERQLIGAVVIECRRIGDTGLNCLRDRRLRAGDRQGAIAAVQATNDRQSWYNADRRQRAMRHAQGRQQKIARRGVRIRHRPCRSDKRNRRIQIGQTDPDTLAMTGASFTGTTVTVEAINSAVVSAPPLAVPPLSWICVSVKVRLPAVGLSVLVS